MFGSDYRVFHIIKIIILIIIMIIIIILVVVVVAVAVVVIIVIVYTSLLRSTHKTPKVIASTFR